MSNGMRMFVSVDFHKLNNCSSRGGKRISKRIEELIKPWRRGREVKEEEKEKK